MPGNVSGNPGACTTRNFTYWAIGPCNFLIDNHDIVTASRRFPQYRSFVRWINHSRVDIPHKGSVVWSFEYLFYNNHSSFKYACFFIEFHGDVQQNRLSQGKQRLIPSLANCKWTECVENSTGAPSDHIVEMVPHQTGKLNTMNFTRFEFNTSRPRQDGRLLADDIFKRIFFNENVNTLIHISLRVFPRCSFNDKSVLVSKMAWRRLVDKPFSKPDD